MSRATPRLRTFAARLIACETSENKSAETTIPTAVLVNEKFATQLAALMGNVAVRALLTRALALANKEIPWLRALHVNADGSIEGLGELVTQVDPDEIAEGRVVLLAQLLGLLIAFIGEELTLRLVREVWTRLPLTLDFGNGDKK